MTNLLFKIMGVGVQKVAIISGFDLVVEVLVKNVYPILLFLNKHTLSQFKTLIDIVCYDTHRKENRFSIVYNCISTHYNLRCRVITKVKEWCNLFSVTGIYRSSNWAEREIFDFFGILFVCNKDLRRILTDYGFKGFPLRKDFPLSGYVDVYYDDNQKRVCYRNLELTQEYRNFNLRNLWI